MKIAFVIDGVMPVYSVKEVLRYDNFDKTTYDFIKVLEANDEFELLVKEIRKKLNIPIKGYLFDQYVDMAIDKNPNIHEFTKDFKELLKNTTRESMPLLNTFKIPQKLVPDIPYIIIANIIHANKSIEVEITDLLEKRDFFELKQTPKIIINYKISKNELIEWIHKNWDDGLSFIKNLEPKPRLQITKRDKEIIRLRDKNGLTFGLIANRIIDKYKVDDSEARINENSVKMAYRRAKAIIKSLKR